MSKLLTVERENVFDWTHACCIQQIIEDLLTGNVGGGGGGDGVGDAKVTVKLAH